MTTKNIKNNMDWKAFLYKSYPFGNRYEPYFHWLPQNLNDLLPIEADLEENGLVNLGAHLSSCIYLSRLVRKLLDESWHPTFITHISVNCFRKRFPFLDIFWLEKYWVLQFVEKDQDIPGGTIRPLDSITRDHVSHLDRGENVSLSVDIFDDIIFL